MPPRAGGREAAGAPGERVRPAGPGSAPLAEALAARREGGGPRPAPAGRRAPGAARPRICRHFLTNPMGCILHHVERTFWRLPNPSGRRPPCAGLRRRMRKRQAPLRRSLRRRLRRSRSGRAVGNVDGSRSGDGDGDDEWERERHVGRHLGRATGGHVGAWQGQRQRQRGSMLSAILRPPSWGPAPPPPAPAPFQLLLLLLLLQLEGGATRLPGAGSLHDSRLSAHPHRNLTPCSAARSPGRGARYRLRNKWALEP